jgi:hypothetical protein
MLTETPTAPAVPRTLRPSRRTVTSVSRHGWRLRKQISPLGVMVGVWVAGCVLRWTGLSWWMALAAGAACTALGAAVSVWQLDRKIERVYAAAVLIAITLWATAATRYGIGRPMPALLAGGGGLLALPWWWHHRLRGSGKHDPEVLPEEAEEDPRIGQWAATVARPGGPLTDSRLVECEDIRGGWAGTIEMLRGNTARAVMATNDIGAALKLKAGSIVIEPPPEGELHLAKILVLPDNPLATRIDWTGPTLDVATGVSVLGQYADGEPVHYRHYRPGSGPVHDLISGSTDSGKSRTVEQLLAEERHSGVIVSHLIDGKGGTSLPDWADAVDEYATTLEEARALLTKDRNRMYLRMSILKTCKWVDDKGRNRKGLSQFTPGDPRHGLPMLSITIDEAQNILPDPVCRALVEEMIGMARSCGIKFRLITPVPLLPSLGNSMIIRDAVAAGNVIILRTANRLTGQVAFNGALPVDPCSLPKEWADGSTTSGLGFVFAPGADRPSTMRVGYVEDPYDWATSGTPAVMEPYTGPPAQGGDGASQETPQPAIVPDDPDQQRIGEDTVLAYLAAHTGQDIARGEMFNAIQERITPPPALRTLTKAITDLCESGHIERVGRGSYRITESGLDRRRQAVA